MVLAYREALAETRRLNAPDPVPVRVRPTSRVDAVSSQIQQDHAIHQAGRIAFGLACATGATACFAAMQAFALALQHGI